MQVIWATLEGEVDMHFGTKLMCHGQDGTKSVNARSWDAEASVVLPLRFLGG